MSRHAIKAWLLLTILVGCSSACTFFQTPPETTEINPQRIRVAMQTQRGPYWMAEISGQAGQLRFYFPPSSSCRQLLQAGRELQYLPEGRFGTLIDPASAASCPAIGLENLAAWRDQLPRRRSRYLLPREPTRLRSIGSSEGFLLARGAIPLALELRIPSPGDVVAILPDTAACRAMLRATLPLLEFRSEGSDVLVFENGCSIWGLAQPILLD